MPPTVIIIIKICLLIYTTKQMFGVSNFLCFDHFK